MRRQHSNQMVSQQFPDSSAVDSPYFSLNPPSAAMSSRSSQKSFLDPTSHNFVSSATFDLDGASRSSRHDSDEESRYGGVKLPFGNNDLGLSMQLGRLPMNNASGYNSSAASRSGSMPPSRSDVDYQTRNPLQNAQYQKFNSSTITTSFQRPQLLPNASSYMSHTGPGGQRQGEQQGQTQMGNLAGNFGKMNVGTENQHPSYATQRDVSYGSHVPFGNGYAQDIPTDSNDVWSRDEIGYLGQQDSFSPNGSGTGSLLSNPNNHRAMTLGPQYSHSPSNSDARYSHASPFYSTAGTPPTFQQRVPSRVPSRGSYNGATSTGQAALLDRKLRGLQQEQQGFMIPTANPLQFRSQFQPPHPYDFHSQQTLRMNQIPPYYQMPPSNLLPAPPIPRGPSRDHDPGQPLRSPLLEEFRNNSKTNKRYELKVGSHSSSHQQDSC